MRVFAFSVGALLFSGCASMTTTNNAITAISSAVPSRTIIMVWDGLRPDSVTLADTPNLFALRQQGVQFLDHHSSYPTFTMMNAAALASGSFPKTSGFYGNTLWTPPQAGAAPAIPAGVSASGASVDYVSPVFTEDYAILTTLNDYYSGQLLLVKTLFKTAQEAGLSTVTIGKSGPAYIQDLGRGGMFVDENTVLPQALARQLQEANFSLPANTGLAYPPSVQFALAANNGNPTARANPLTFAMPNGLQARDASDATQGAPEDASNQYMMKIYIDFILPKKKPDLSLIWFRTPDNTEHAYGPGSANYRKALASQDARLGELQAGLNAAGLTASTNIIVVSDHAHSNVSGPSSLFPLRAITPATTIANGVTNATLGAPDPLNGFSVSGDVRSADLLTYAGFKAFDGSGCQTSAMAGMTADGRNLYPLETDRDHSLCGGSGSARQYQAISAKLSRPVASFKVPAVLPAKAIVVAANGGSDYFYVPDHDLDTVAALVRFLQSREEYGAVFVDNRYGALPGALSMSAINLQNPLRANKGQPDVVVSFNWDAQQRVNGLPGTTFESFSGARGMHGSFSPIDVHNTLIASGPAFLRGLTLGSPSGNVDVAPTVAFILGQAMPQADGRILNEALLKPASSATLVIQDGVIHPGAAATGLQFKLPSDPSGATLDPVLVKGDYSINLKIKDVAVDGKSYRYFDYAQPLRN